MRRRVLTFHLGTAIGCYLVAERGHSWAVSWSGPLALVDGKGNSVDPYAMPESLLDDPSSGGRLRRCLGGVARLRAFRTSSTDPLEPQGHTETATPSAGAWSIRSRRLSAPSTVAR